MNVLTTSTSPNMRYGAAVFIQGLVERRLVPGLVPRPVVAVLETLEDQRGLGMSHRHAGLVGQQVLLGHIGDVAALLVFGEQVVKRLVLARPDVLRNRLPSFLGIVEGAVDIEDHVPERKDPVLDQLADRKLGGSIDHEAFLTHIA